jgi:DeoR family fructose operon transcriptional repressor
LTFLFFVDKIQSETSKINLKENAAMLSQERYQLIMSLLNRRRTVTVTELTQELGASEATVRRDLNTLHEMGRLQKIHGGATLLPSNFIAHQEDLSLRCKHNTEVKALLGRYAATLIQDDDFVYIDAGSTTGYLVDALGHSQATFVTNGFSHAHGLARKGLRTYILGGEFKSATETAVGSVATISLRRYHFTKCFLGAGGISQEAGFTAPDAEDAMLKAEVAERSYMVYVLADHSKFNSVDQVTFAQLERACIVTDRLTDESYRSLTMIREVSET